MSDRSLSGVGTYIGLAFLSTQGLRPAARAPTAERGAPAALAELL